MSYAIQVNGRNAILTFDNDGSVEKAGFSKAKRQNFETMTKASTAALKLKAFYEREVAKYEHLAQAAEAYLHRLHIRKDQIERKMNELQYRPYIEVVERMAKLHEEMAVVEYDLDPWRAPTPAVLRGYATKYKNFLKSGVEVVFIYE